MNMKQRIKELLEKYDKQHYFQDVTARQTFIDDYYALSRTTPSVHTS